MTSQTIWGGFGAITPTSCKESAWRTSPLATRHSPGGGYNENINGLIVLYLQRPDAGTEPFFKVFTLVSFCVALFMNECDFYGFKCPRDIVYG
ncbi:hypothetical protein ATY02_12225 [Pseudomonas sp. BIOMIG1BAC]|uniref:hypothetical protein n=1 Tax=Pseudomonas sp. BIOMIG1BAC TaxID=1758730 RepID=UPI0013E16BA0|nr:hypothetical protein [Pseudomonas sp. BIOMIG1BAC]QIH07430.1 hypothetical protein ATY02_12225 [Pseudomonas sp. BIOMIG1BAC]